MVWELCDTYQATHCEHALCSNASRIEPQTSQCHTCSRMPSEADEAMLIQAKIGGILYAWFNAEYWVLITRIWNWTINLKLGAGTRFGLQLTKIHHFTQFNGLIQYHAFIVGCSRSLQLLVDHGFNTYGHVRRTVSAKAATPVPLAVWQWIKKGRGQRVRLAAVLWAFLAVWQWIKKGQGQRVRLGSVLSLTALGSVLQCFDTVGCGPY